MNLGEAGTAWGVSAEMIRHYESMGRSRPPPARGRATASIQKARSTLRFILRARDVGFSINQMRELLTLWRDRDSSADVKRIALKQVEVL